MEEHVRVRADENPEVSVEAMHPPDRPRGVFGHPERAVGIPLDTRHREVRDEVLDDAHGSGAGPSAAVGRRERLVGVDVDDVEAHVAGSAPAHDRVEVRAVVVHEPADVVDDRRDPSDVLLEQTEGVRVREHQTGDVLVDEAGERIDVDQSTLRGGHGHRPVPTEPSARRVGAVGRIGDQDRAPRVPEIGVMRAHDEQPGELPGRARGRLKGRAGHPGDLAQGGLEPPEHLKGSLHRPIPSWTYSERSGIANSCYPS